MLSRAAECARLSLIVQRWLDADLLLAEEGAALLAQVAEARRALDGRDAAAARRHTRRFVQVLDALVETGLLEEPRGRLALAAARQMLDDIDA